MAVLGGYIAELARVVAKEGDTVCPEHTALDMAVAAGQPQKYICGTLLSVVQFDLGELMAARIVFGFAGLIKESGGVVGIGCGANALKMHFTCHGAGRGIVLLLTGISKEGERLRGV